MSDKLSSKDVYIKPNLTATKKVGGRVEQVELETPHFTDDDIGGLLDGVSNDEIMEGREVISRENPEFAAKSGRDSIASLQDIDVSSDISSPTKSAATKRMGSIVDRSTGESLDFRRLKNGSVELSSPDDGGVLDVLDGADFDQLLDSNEFQVI